MALMEYVLGLQIPIVDDEMKKAAGEVKEDGKCFVCDYCCHTVLRRQIDG